MKKRGPLKWRPKFALKPRDKRAPDGGGSVSGLSGTRMIASHITGLRLPSANSPQPTLRPSTSHSIITTSPPHPSTSYSAHANDSTDPSLWRNLPLNNTLDPSHTGGLTETSHTNQTLQCSGKFYYNDALEEDPEILKPVSDAALARYFVPDSIGRVLHPHKPAML